MAQQKIKISIPKDLPPDARIDLADLVIEHIVERSQSGKDKNGKNFPRYSKEYTRSLDFKIAGKSKSKVDLQLSGDMLAAIELLSQKNGEITVGFENGTEENSRAEGNILGSYGRTPDKKKARDFLGIEKDKLSELVEFIRDDYDL